MCTSMTKEKALSLLKQGKSVKDLINYSVPHGCGPCFETIMEAYEKHLKKKPVITECGEFDFVQKGGKNGSRT